MQDVRHSFNTLRKFIYILMLFAFFSCNNDTEEEEEQQEEIDPDDYFQIGGGTDPLLNIPEYTFSREGGSIIVYSTLGHELDVHTSDRDCDTLYWSVYKMGYPRRGFEGEWWSAAFPNYYPALNLEIKVSPNETGEERKVPITVWYGDWGGGNYTQEK